MQPTTGFAQNPGVHRPLGRHQLPPESGLLFSGLHKNLDPPEPLTNQDKVHKFKTQTLESSSPWVEFRPYSLLAMTLDHSPANPRALASHLRKEKLGHLSFPSPTPRGVGCVQGRRWRPRDPGRSARAPGPGCGASLWS